MLSLNDCLWLSEDEADIFQEQQSKTKTYISNAYDLGDSMFHLNDCLCLFYCSNALNIKHSNFIFVSTEDKQQHR